MSKMTTVDYDHKITTKATKAELGKRARLQDMSHGDSKMDYHFDSLSQRQGGGGIIGVCGGVCGGGGQSPLLI